jgi:LysM repeat protein
MNRKNTILIAVLINAGLLAVLLVAALTTQNELPSKQSSLAEAPLQLPKFEEHNLFLEHAPIVHSEVLKLPEIEQPLAIEPVIHKLPPLVAEEVPVPVVAAAPVSQLPPVTPAQEVVVKKGDNLEKLAKANHTTVDEILKLNQLPSSFLKVGQVLKLPAPKVVEKKEPQLLNPEYYTMKVGDNPWAVAMKHHIKVDELLRLNGLNEERARKLKPGDRLRVR